MELHWLSGCGSSSREMRTYTPSSLSGTRPNPKPLFAALVEHRTDPQLLRGVMDWDPLLLCDKTAWVEQLQSSNPSYTLYYKEVKGLIAEAEERCATELSLREIGVTSIQLLAQMYDEGADMEIILILYDYSGEINLDLSRFVQTAAMNKNETLSRLTMRYMQGALPRTYMTRGFLGRIKRNFWGVN